LGTIHAEIAITLKKLGNLYYETGDLRVGLEGFYHQGLQVELTVLEPGNPNVCVTYTNIAEIHKQRSEFRKALNNYNKVLTLQRKYAADPLDIADALSSIGYVRHQKGDYQGAMEVNQECLRIRREFKGDIDEEVASTLTHIALVLLKMDMHDMALGVLTEAYHIRTSLSKTENRDIAFTLYNIAPQGSHEQALVFYRETARVEKAALGQAHRDLSITYYNIGQIYYQRGEMELAIDSFKEALSIERKCFGGSHPTCARTLNEIGNIELQSGNVEQVMECYAAALRICREADVSDDHLVIYGRSLWRFEIIQPAAALEQHKY
jgi:tetratricopeptide (TPR) repeat protein